MKKLNITCAAIGLVFLMSQVALAIPITVLPGAVAASSYLDAPHMPGNTVDGIHANNLYGYDMWLTSGVDAVAGSWISWDMGQVYSLEKAHIWNYNQNFPGAGGYNRGIKEVDIYVSTLTAPGVIGSVDWTLFKQDTFSIANGLADDPGFDFDFSGTQARYVGFKIVTRQGELLLDGSADGQYVGLSEIEFNGSVAVPEPSTMLLLGFGVIGLGVAGRRKLGK